MSVLLFSSPPPNYEKYIDHIKKCKEKFEIVFPIFYDTIIRIFDLYSINEKENIKDSFLKIILFHDLGKLTQKWQDKALKKERTPSHSTLGAAYLWQILPDNIKEPLSFAVAIHHTDKGLLGDNIERPDVQAILDIIVDNSGKVNWHNETEKLQDYYFPKYVKNVNIVSLKNMAIGLRIWAKGFDILEQQKRRLQATLAHHILKLCDISAAAERKEYEKSGKTDYYGGWLMVENIVKYVNGINERVKQ